MAAHCTETFGRLRCSICDSRVTFVTDGLCDHCWAAKSGSDAPASWPNGQSDGANGSGPMEAGLAAVVRKMAGATA